MKIKTMFQSKDPNYQLPERQGLDLLFEEGMVELDPDTLGWVYLGPFKR